MVLYVEACESGSMFQGLLTDEMQIYVTTAANAYESSWGTYCPGVCSALERALSSSPASLITLPVWMDPHVQEQLHQPPADLCQAVQE